MEKRLHNRQSSALNALVSVRNTLDREPPSYFRELGQIAVKVEWDSCLFWLGQDGLVMISKAERLGVWCLLLFTLANPEYAQFTPDVLVTSIRVIS